MKPRPRMLIPVLIFVVALLALAGSIAFGGPTPPAPMATINDPFRSVDFSDLPPVLIFQASDGQPLAYREYVPVGVQRGSVTLIHGSSASSNSMHPMAKALAAAGYKAFALDMRGHGQSGAKGHIRHIGQLDSDLADFVRAVRPPQPSTLAGFSSGGGFVLRFAGGENQSLFGSYLLLSPFLSESAPNQRPGSGGWVNVGVPRIIGLAVLNSLGIRAFNWLPVASFALNEQARTLLTPEYDFNLAMNFRPERDYVANIQRVAKPCAVLAGAADEAFRTEKLEEIVRAAGKGWEVELLPNVGHIPLTLEPSAVAVMVRHVRKLQQAV
ncbi:MAG: alpha/beta fold hydrolase [Betaproteobacteria bacterium]|nr:alpha/beta fold hydrolase [Betaproteobacteria bacterium]